MVVVGGDAHQPHRATLLGKTPNVYTRRYGQMWALAEPAFIPTMRVDWNVNFFSGAWAF